MPLKRLKRGALYMNGRAVNVIRSTAAATRPTGCAATAAAGAADTAAAFLFSNYIPDSAENSSTDNGE